MALLLCGLAFAVFSGNVVAGALFSSPFMADVAEMLTLLASSVLFVVAILSREAARDRASAQHSTNPRHRINAQGGPQ